MVSVQMHRMDIAAVVLDRHRHDIALRNHEHRHVRKQMTVNRPPQARTAVQKSRTPVDYVLKFTIRMLRVKPDVGRRAVAERSTKSRGGSVSATLRHRHPEEGTVAAELNADTRCRHLNFEIRTSTCRHREGWTIDQVRLIHLVTVDCTTRYGAPDVHTDIGPLSVLTTRTRTVWPS